MKISMSELAELASQLDGVEQLLPLVEVIRPTINKIADSTADILSALEPLFIRYGDWARSRRVQAIDYYEKNGFTREQAMLLSMHDEQSIEILLKAVFDGAKRKGTK